MTECNDPRTTSPVRNGTEARNNLFLVGTSADRNLTSIVVIYDDASPVFVKSFFSFSLYIGSCSLCISYAFPPSVSGQVVMQ